MQLCLGLVKGLNMKPVEQLRHIKAAGFDGFFALWEHPGQLDQLATEADALGLLFQSVHAPFRQTSAMWEPGSSGDMALQELLSCLEDCKRLHVPIMVSHVFMGFEVRMPTELGIQRFARLFSAAEEAGVQVALENVESIPHLQTLLDAFPNVRFCWDSGHGLCYNKDYDLLSMYGHRIAATHLNDNFGVQHKDGIISKYDDLHLLPFDGKMDWDQAMQKLGCFSGPLTFELSFKHYNDMLPADFFVLAYQRACRVAAKRG